MDPKGKMGHKSARAKVAREEREKPKKAEMEVDGVVPREESVESQSPKRKGIQVESEETQDWVRETLAISQEEAEEISTRAHSLVRQSTQRKSYQILADSFNGR